MGGGGGVMEVKRREGERREGERREGERGVGRKGGSRMEGYEERSYNLQQFSGRLSKNRDENPRMHKIFNSKSPPKGCACADNQPENCSIQHVTPPPASHHNQ